MAIIGNAGSLRLDYCGFAPHQNYSLLVVFNFKKKKYPNNEYLRFGDNSDFWNDYAFYV